jgi:predicted chitinase
MRASEFFDDQHPNEKPRGPETKPTMPAGTVRVDVSDVYDWYKLGQHISDLEGLGKHDFGQGPPSTILSFGSEQEEHEYLGNLEKIGLATTDIDPVDPNQPKNIKRQKTDPTYNVDEAKVLGADQLVNVYIRGKHGKRDINKLIAQDFPNKHIDLLIKKLVDKHNVNPNAIVYGTPAELDEDWKSALAKGALAGAVALGGAAQAKTPTNPYQNYEKDPIAQIIQQRQAELSAKDKKTVQQVAQRVQAKKAKETPYVPVTGSKLETLLYNYARKVGLRGTELAAFMGQTAHESDNFKTTKEYSSGEQYEGRKDLGNIYRGDGVKYKGRGFIQLTGRYNYTQASKDLGIDLVKHPELAERPDVAAKVTWWYWKNRVRPNVSSFSDVKQVTKQINPAMRGLEKRKLATRDFKLAQR